MLIESGMTSDLKIKLKGLLIKHEGNRDYPYYDSLGNITIGIGRNLSGVGIREDEKELMFKNDTEFLYEYLIKNYPWFSELNEARKIAIIDMAFMGIKHFASFEKMIEAMKEKNYSVAANEILDSYYAKKFISRSHDVANIILTGDL